MGKLLKSTVISTGLAIFTMLFGAGNLIYPIQVGMESGNNYWIGIFGFLITAVFLPALGFISMILFNGNYKSFFYRLGRMTGSTLLFLCILVIGPIIAIPRVITLSHTLIAPYLSHTRLMHINPTSSLIFALIFLSITFLLTYRENRIVTILGNIIAPILLISLLFIIIKGLLTPGYMVNNGLSRLTIFKESFMRGYETLDLLAALFFSSIAINILKRTMEKTIINNPRVLAYLGLKASVIGVMFLGLIYVGLCFLGAQHVGNINEYVLAISNQGELFRVLSFQILGVSGSLLIIMAVLMACLSTAIALSAIVAEYVSSEIFRGKASYILALILVLIACLPLSIAGLSKVLELSAGPLIYVGYPVLITLTVCNVGYKLFDFKPVKIPVAIVFVATLFSWLS